MDKKLKIILTVSIVLNILLESKSEEFKQRIDDLMQ
jgi:hypothetical protein